jgi:hypothetical protein
MASFVSCMFVAYSKPAVLLLSGQAVLCCMVRHCFVVWSGSVVLFGQAVLSCMVSACMFSLSLHVTEKYPVSLVKPLGSYDRAS